MFNIRDYVHKLENVIHHSTWDEATCPVCDGKLKISKSYPREGSYACYTNYCHTLKNSKGINLVRSKLEEVTPFTRNTRFRESRIFKSSISLAPTPIHVESDIDLISSIEYSRPKIEIDSENQQRRIFFDYGEFQLVRVESTVGVFSKYVYPIHYENNSNFYTKGLPSCVTLPFYRPSYISKDLLIVEGEKCASFCQKLGLSAISIYTPFSSSFILDELLGRLKQLGVENIIYLEDNDVPGRVKALKLLEAAWRKKIAASSINITDLYENYKDTKGFDIVDLYIEKEIHTKEDVLDIVQRGLHG